MGHLFEKHVQAFQQTEILGHDLLQVGVFGINGHIYLGAGQIDFQRFGSDHHLSPQPWPGEGAVNSSAKNRTSSMLAASNLSVVGWVYKNNVPMILPPCQAAVAMNG
jgi:hypothetical protein